VLLLLLLEAQALAAAAAAVVAALLLGVELPLVAGTRGVRALHRCCH
jgi:hypothetical protein